MNDREQSFDDRADAYRKSGDLVAAIARYHYRLTIDETTSERWRQIMALMREVDTWLDDWPVTSHEVLAELSSFERFATRYPDITPRVLGQDRYRQMEMRAHTIFALGEYAARTTDLADFIECRSGEASETVNLFADTATDVVRQQPAFESQFLPAIRALGSAATLFDSIVDGGRDVRTGKQRIVPDRVYYLELGRGIKAFGRAGGRGLLHTAPLFHIASKGVKRAVNRARNGMQEYSTLSLLRRR